MKLMLQLKPKLYGGAVSSFMEEQSQALPELYEKWGTTEFRDISHEDTVKFRAAVQEFGKTQLAKIGFKEFLGMGTSAGVFRFEVDGKDYIGKAYFKVSDRKDDERYGHFKYTAWTNHRELNLQNDIVDGLKKAASSEARFDFVQGRSRLYPPDLKDLKPGETPVLVVPFKDASPAISGEIHYKPIEEWTVNPDLIDKGVNAQYISDFMHFLIAA